MAKQQKEDVHEIIRQAVEAGWAAAKSSPKDAYKATERRLYALPVLRMRIVENRENLEELRIYGVRGKSGSITRFCKNGGMRLDPEEAKDRLVQDLESRIAFDQMEVDTMEKALSTIAGDAYYKSVEGKYIDGKNDDEIAAEIPCDTSTVWRNRKRLVQRLAVWLYGAMAIL